MLPVLALPSLLLLVLPLLPAVAFREFMLRVPNSGAVPCPGNLAGCWGRPFCEAFGHEDCLPSGEVTDFGESVHDASGWTQTLCASDADGDSFTNGDELGDPCCSWKYTESPPILLQGSAQAAAAGALLPAAAGSASSSSSMLKTGGSFAAELSHPGERSSTPSTRGSCSRAASLSTPTAVAVALASDGSALEVSWQDSSSCSCEAVITITSRSTGSSSSWAARGGSWSLCQSAAAAAAGVSGLLQPSDVASVTVGVKNRANGGAAVLTSAPVLSASFIPLSQSNRSAAVVEACSRLSSSTLAAAAASSAAYPLYYSSSPRWMNSIPAGGGGSHGDSVEASSTPSPSKPLAGAAAALALLAALTVATYGCLVRGKQEPDSCFRRKCLQQSACASSWCFSRGSKSGPASKPASSSASSSSACSTLFQGLLPELALASPSAFLFFTVFLVGLAISLGVAFQWYSPQVYAFGDSLPVERAAGYALGVSFAAMLLPVTRHSLWLPLLGISYERALRFHRWASSSTVALLLWHSLSMVTAYCGGGGKLSSVSKGGLGTGSIGGSISSIGCSHLVWWSSDAGVNPLAGTLSGLLLLLITIVALFRRRIYHWHLITHCSWPLAVLFALLHTPQSSTPLWHLFLLPLVLLGLDLLLLVRDAVFAPTRLLRAEVIEEATAGTTAAGGTGSSPSPAVVRLTLQKGSGGSWSYAPGQFINIVLPSISYLPHPITISSAPDAKQPGLFTLHIRDMGPGTWSGKLLQEVRRRKSSAGSGSAAPLSAIVVGPFGSPSLQLHRYSHFLLVGGGIGITPLAALSGSLARVAEGEAGAAEAVDGLGDSQSSQQLHMQQQQQQQEQLRLTPELGLGCLSLQQGKAMEVPLRTVRNVWAVREPALLQEFAPLLLGKGGEVGQTREAGRQLLGVIAGGADAADAAPAGVYRLSRSIGSRTTVQLEAFLTAAGKGSGAGAAGGAATGGAASVAPAAFESLGRGGAGASLQPVSSDGRSLAVPAWPDCQLSYSAGSMRPQWDAVLLATAAAARSAEVEGRTRLLAGGAAAAGAGGSSPRIPPLTHVAVVACGPAAMLEELQLAVEAFNKREERGAGGIAGAAFGGEKGAGAVLPPSLAAGGAVTFASASAQAQESGSGLSRVRFHLHTETFLL